ncbi:toxin-antitoxin system HicB family antitoxin [Amycolatopsis sp. 195334CR]|uniref:toxin-antitoxin system HicB family antitoxin n=1 Tax=Amycolatopsis sp. 195334CR TaxID=2814588 RepID=UPI001A8D8405|nr:toxin-antitoxin system HicB family antitoxin [Amycolatopsis sp. 195334CR]MBN6037898.1 toxin-antitoxin system HicB family antitoxin [Amycolatopsis sp. 195334CR]
MDLTTYISSLREDLATAASAGDEQTRQTAAVLAATLEPAMRLALMNALADLAAEVTANQPDYLVDVRLDGRDVRVVVTGTSGAGEKTESEPAAEKPREPKSEPKMPFDSGEISRMTLRLFDQVKNQAERAASAQGVSLNTFVTQAVQGALQGKAPFEQGEQRRGPNSSTRMHGWVQG